MIQQQICEQIAKTCLLVYKRKMSSVVDQNNLFMTKSSSAVFFKFYIVRRLSRFGTFDTCYDPTEWKKSDELKFISFISQALCPLFSSLLLFGGISFHVILFYDHISNKNAVYFVFQVFMTGKKFRVLCLFVFVVFLFHRGSKISWKKHFKSVLFFGWNTKCPPKTTRNKKWNGE